MVSKPPTFLKSDGFWWFYGNSCKKTWFCSRPAKSKLAILRSNWPQTSYTSSFSFKYHITIAIFCMRLFRGRFEEGPILLLKWGFSQFDLQPQDCFEVREILLWALWLPLTKCTLILRTMASNAPIPGNGWFLHTLLFL